MGTLKPMTPLQPLMQASMKPPSPLLAPNKGPLKPTTPLRPKNAPKTRISHPQRRWRFQPHTGTSGQRRQRFQLRLGQHPQRRQLFQPHTGTIAQRRQRFQTSGPPGRQSLTTAPVDGGWAWPGDRWVARGRPTLQTSSNRSSLNILASAHVTNVVNLRPKTLIFSEKAVGLTTFVTTDQKSTRKTPSIDDVCNNTQRSAPKSQYDKPDHIGGPEGLAAAAGPGQASRRRTQPHISDHAPLV